MLVKHPLIQFREAFESLEKETAKEYYETAKEYYETAKEYYETAKEYYETAVARERSFSRS